MSTDDYDAAYEDGWEAGYEDGKQRILDDLADLKRDLTKHLGSFNRTDYQAHIKMLERIEQRFRQLGVQPCGCSQLSMGRK